MNDRIVKVVWLGSSVTYGSANGGVSMADYLNGSGFECFKYAVSGTTLTDDGPKSYISRLKNADLPDECDFFICQLSTNDARKVRPLGEIGGTFDVNDFDTQTIAGAIEYIIAFAKEKWGCRTAFYINPPYPNEHYEKMVGLMLKIGKKWDIPILDMWNHAETADMTGEAGAGFYGKYMADAIHPNGLGYLEWWTPMFREFIVKHLK